MSNFAVQQEGDIWAAVQKANIGGLTSERLHCGCATDEHTTECPTIHGDIARQAHAMSHPSAQRQHISDAAWQARLKVFPHLNNYVGRHEFENDHVIAGTVLLTVAEHDELLAAEDRLANSVYEDHALRCEIDALRAELAAAQRAQIMLQSVNADLHRQLRGRDDKRAQGMDAGRILEAASEGAELRHTPVVRSMGQCVSAALSFLPEPDKRLGRGNGAMDE